MRFFYISHPLLLFGMALFTLSVWHGVLQESHSP